MKTFPKLIACLALTLFAPQAWCALIDDQITKFFELAKANRNEQALGMLQNIKGFVQSADFDGDSVLIAAATSGNEVVLDAVLKLSPDLDHANKKGCTAVWLVSGVTTPVLLKKLLQAGASPVKPGNDGKTSPLMAAALANRPEVAQTLLDAKAPVDTELDGKTALGIAVTAGFEGVVTVLLKAGANPNAKMAGTPLIAVARNRGFKNIEALLLAGGAK